MTPESPVNAGHSYANAAEEYEDREDWSKALEAHKKAADQFQKAVEYTQDPVACKTLKLLATDHLRKVKELERKVVKGRIASQVYRPYDMEGLRHALPERKPVAMGTATPAIGGSYAVLLSSSEEEEEEDPFNKFWHVVETLVDKLSNPVAFASAPLNEDDNPTPQWPATTTATTASVPTVTVTDDEGAMLQSYFVVPEEQLNDNNSIFSRSSHDYAAENEQLKKQVAQLTKKIQALEKAAEESNTLKSSILQFRDDVQKHAKRIMQSHDSNGMRASAAVLGSAAGYHNSADLLARIRELEEENQQLKIQGEKQQALMNKYRERWEKLKESAKKRRAQPEQQTLNDSSGITQPRLASPCASEYSRQPTLLRSLAQQSQTYSTAASPPSSSTSSAASSRFSTRRSSSMPGNQDRKVSPTNK